MPSSSYPAITMGPRITRESKFSKTPGSKSEQRKLWKTRSDKPKTPKTQKSWNSKNRVQTSGRSRRMAPYGPGAAYMCRTTPNSADFCCRNTTTPQWLDTPDVKIPSACWNVGFSGQASAGMLATTYKRAHPARSTKHPDTPDELHSTHMGCHPDHGIPSPWT